MKSLLLSVGTLLLFSGMPARAGVTYSTLGCTVPIYDSGHGYVVTGASLPPGYTGLAIAFVPSATYDVTFMDLALFHLGGIDSAVVQLQSDNAGTPGTVMGSWTVSPGEPLPYSLLGIAASGRVTAGQQYWISVQPNGDDTSLGWALNSQGLSGTLAVTHDGTTFLAAQEQVLPAIDLLGNAVPEPSTVVLCFAAITLLAYTLCTPATTTAR
jgi:hypothetical protein